MFASEEDRCRDQVADSAQSAGTKLSQRLFRVLDAVHAMGRPVSLGEIALRTGLPKSTVHRLVRDLEAAGFVDRTSTDSYHLGLSLFSYGERARQQHELRLVATRYLTQLASATGAMAQLAVARDDQALVLERVAGRSGIVLPARVGALIPLHAGALGRAILAWLPPAEVSAYLAEPLVRFTERTSVDKVALSAELSEIRARGYALDRGGIVEGLSTFAVPISSGGPAASAAVALSFTRRLSQAAQTDLVKSLLLAKHHIESHFDSLSSSAPFAAETVGARRRLVPVPSTPV